MMVVPVRSKYSNVLRPWVISPRPERLWENVTRPILDRVTLCYVRFECFSLDIPFMPQPLLDSNRSSSLTIRAAAQTATGFKKKGSQFGGSHSQQGAPQRNQLAMKRILNI